MVYEIKLTEAQVKTIMSALFGVEADFGDAEEEMKLYKYFESLTGLDPYF